MVIAVLPTVDGGRLDIYNIPCGSIDSLYDGSIQNEEGGGVSDGYSGVVRTQHIVLIVAGDAFMV